MKRRAVASVLVLCAFAAPAATIGWTNIAGGNWHDAVNWLPNQVPGVIDTANITTSGTYTVTTTNAVSVSALNLGAPSGTQTLLINSAGPLNATNSAAVRANGVLMVTNGGLQGQFTVLSGGQLLLSGAAGKTLYGLTLLNQGTVRWSGGALQAGSTPTTVISNSGLWEMQSDDPFFQAVGGPPPLWINSGTFRKSGGSGLTQINSFNFANTAGGTVEVQAGTLRINSGTNSTLGGTFTTSTGATLDLASGTFFETGGVFNGPGANNFSGGILNLRTNALAGLLLSGGDVNVIGANFQQAGAITNLTLMGSTLRGTNRVGNGALTINTGGASGQLTVQPGGQLLLSGTASKTLYSLTLLNQGTVTWNGGTLQAGSTPTTVISNGGVWQVQSDEMLSQGIGGPAPQWINSGTLRKSGSGGLTQINSFNFANTASGLVEVQTGILRINSGTNSILGGTFTTSTGATLDLASGAFFEAGGMFNGAGANYFSGGTLNLRTNSLSGLLLNGGDTFIIGSNFQEAGAITNLTLNGSILRGSNRVGNGTLTINLGGASGLLTVQPGGQLLLSGAAGMSLYSLTLLNQGTVTWSGGPLSAGSTPTTVISNSGLWVVQSDETISQSIGGALPQWVNSGTLRKSGGTGLTQINSFNFANTAGGLVEVLAGTLRINSGTNSALGGTFATTNGATLDLASGTFFDAGGVFNGAGANRLSGGTLNLRTDTLPGLSLSGGNVYVIGPSFQEAGAITNLTISGSMLRGTNRVGNGTLTINAGGTDGLLTVLPGGQLLLSGATGKSLFSLTLLNQGTVTWSGGPLSAGSTPTTVISNSGLWVVQSDETLNWAVGGPPPQWANSGTLRKSGGTGLTLINNFNFANTAGGLVEVQAGILRINGWTNSTLGGTFTTSAGATLELAGGTFFDAGGVFNGAGTNRLNGGTLNLRTDTLPGLSLSGGNVYVIGPSFQEAGAITNLTISGSTLRGTNRVGNGTLTINAGGMDGLLTVQPGGQLLLSGAAGKSIYGLTLLNQGTVTWSGGPLSAGNTPTTVISNSGLWLVQSDETLTQSIGGPPPQWANSGTLRKSGGTGLTLINSFNFDNTAGGLVEVQTGTLRISSGTNSSLGGTFTSLAGATLELASGTFFDASAVFNGAGTNRMTGGTLNLRTNALAGLLLTGGNVYVIGSSFQEAGAITNLTISGSTLRGTNRVGNGTLAVNAGGMDGLLTVQPAGRLLLSGPVSKSLYSLTLLNQGTVIWSGGNLGAGGTPTTVISNGGLWEVQIDSALTQAIGGPPPLWANSGILRKSAGGLVTQIDSFNFSNAVSGVVEVNTGTLRLPSNTTITTGILRVNGGRIEAIGTLTLAGGRLEGSGSVGNSLLNGGEITPGLSGPGSIGFPSGLNLGSGATLTMSGTGTVPGTQYDQLSVTGAASINGCTLQVTSLPSVPTGTTFVLIANDGVDAVQGTFAGLPENAAINVSGQPFRIHYAGGTGNDVTLVRDPGGAGVQLSSGGYNNGTFRLIGRGDIVAVYSVLATTDLIQWTNIGSATADLNGNVSFNDTNAFRFSYRFYRTTN